MVATAKLKIPKAAELVCRQLRAQIVRGQLHEGSVFAAERDLMEQFGVSRPTLREAIRILESEGLVSIQRGARGGTVVHRPNEAVATRYVSLVLQARGTTLMDICRVHRVIEPAAVRIVAEQFSLTAPATLRASLQFCRSAIDNDFEFGSATASFRNKLIELTESSTLTLLMSMVNDISQRHFGMMALSGGKFRNYELLKRRALRALEKVIELIEAADGEGAERHWRKHRELVERGMRLWQPAAQVIDLLDN